MLSGLFCIKIDSFWICVINLHLENTLIYVYICISVAYIMEI